MHSISGLDTQLWKVKAAGNSVSGADLKILLEMRLDSTKSK